MKTNEELIKYFSDLLQNAEVTEGKQYVEIKVKKEDWHETAKKIATGDIKFDYLVDITAVDYNPVFTIVAHITASETHEFIVLKTDIENRENPIVDSLYDIWATAEFMEREIFDLFGIKFNNHPDLRRLFLEDDYGYPLRKDFKDDINMIELKN